MSEMTEAERNRFVRRCRASCRNPAYAINHERLCRSIEQSTYEARMAFLTSWKRGGR